MHGHPKKLTRSAAGRIIKPWDQYAIKSPNTQVYFCPGNHEDWEDLLLRKDFPAEVMPNVFYMCRGSFTELPDGRVVLFMGGAYSIDREMRTIGIDWFPQEVIPYSEVYKLEALDIPKVDIVISHTCPIEFNPTLDKKRLYNGWEYKFQDGSQEVLSAIMDMYKPNLWYFGHFHITTNGTYNNTNWFCLNYANNPGWWRYLDG